MLVGEMLECDIILKIVRTILLWIFHRWKIFYNPRQCLYVLCQSFGRCSGLLEAIITRCPHRLTKAGNRALSAFGAIN